MVPNEPSDARRVSDSTGDTSFMRSVAAVLEIEDTESRDCFCGKFVSAARGMP
jgi:hypothetical protein